MTPRLRYPIGIDTDELVSKSLNRTRRALADKLPKLQSARQSPTDVTLLLLEAIGLQLTNPRSVYRDLRRHVEAEQLPAPDHILLVIDGPDEVPSIAFILREAAKWLQQPVPVDGTVL